jgi:hypothetical protein
MSKITNQSDSGKNPLADTNSQRASLRDELETLAERAATPTKGGKA